MASELAPQITHDYRPGDVIAQRYVLQHKLGEGGMGVVWVAQSTALDVPVALKMLRRELAGTQAVERMAREARTAAQLGHPALVRVLDFGTSQHGEPFLAMELLEGEELHARLAREKRIAAETAVALLLPIIDGLGTAHDKGIVHRDIKPENIFIAVDGQGRVQPKVLDFGIAKLDRDQNPSRLTQAGDVMGSPYYLSPEQAEGLDDIDLRSDIWSLGVVLYEIVAGVAPFAASNYNALIRSILKDAPISLTARAAGDAQLWTILERCLRKDREQRWSSMWELGEALALWLFERGVRVDAAARSIKHTWLEGGLTGLQILVASEPPDPATLPPAPMPLPPRGELPSSDSSIEPGPLARTHLRPARKRWPKLLAVTGVLAAAGLALAWSQRAHLPLELPHKTAQPAPFTPQPEVAPAQAVPAAVVSQALSAPTPVEALAPEALASSPAPAARLGGAAPKRLAPVRKQPGPAAPAAAPQVTSAPKPKAGRAANTEFGF